MTVLTKCAVGLDESPLDAAARRMYDAEVALHAARQAHVDEWVAAAYGRLHDAIEDHTAALSCR
jgi:hypothetical protein